MVRFINSAIDHVTGVRLTCGSVGLINRCTVTWEVSYSLLYVCMYLRTYLLM